MNAVLAQLHAESQWHIAYAIENGQITEEQAVKIAKFAMPFQFGTQQYVVASLIEGSLTYLPDGTMQAILATNSASQFHLICAIVGGLPDEDTGKIANFVMGFSTEGAQQVLVANIIEGKIPFLSSDAKQAILTMEPASQTSLIFALTDGRIGVDDIPAVVELAIASPDSPQHWVVAEICRGWV
jgi:hypothetical protein